LSSAPALLLAGTPPSLATWVGARGIIAMGVGMPPGCSIWGSLCYSLLLEKSVGDIVQILY
jgi:hypothetical protein